MPFIMMQQVQPAVIMALMQSQQDWIMAQQSLSPLVQVMHTPSLVISHLHRPIVRLQQHTIMPFIMQQQLHMVPASEVHRFCSVVAAILSSQTHVTFMPPVTFSNFILQRGIIAMFIGIMPGMGVPIPGVIMPGMPMPMFVGFVSVFIMTTVSLTKKPRRAAIPLAAPRCGALDVQGTAYLILRRWQSFPQIL
jgi:hypothetical protein